VFCLPPPERQASMSRTSALLELRAIAIEAATLIEQLPLWLPQPTHLRRVPLNLRLIDLAARSWRSYWLFMRHLPIRLLSLIVRTQPCRMRRRHFHHRLDR
jgi:hypothetical protein